MKLALIAGALTACSGCTFYPGPLDAAEESAEPENVGLEHAAIGEAQCKFATPDSQGTGYVDVYSPSSYNNASCPRAFVAQVNNFLAASNKYFHLAYVDVIPTNSAACTSIYVRMDVYKLVNGDFVLQAANIKKYGIWFSAINKCSPPLAHWNPPSNGTYKITMQARRDVSISDTMKMHFHTSQ